MISVAENASTTKMLECRGLAGFESRSISYARIVTNAQGIPYFYHQTLTGARGCGMGKIFLLKLYFTIYPLKSNTFRCIITRIDC